MNKNLMGLDDDGQPVDSLLKSIDPRITFLDLDWYNLKSNEAIN